MIRRDIVIDGKVFKKQCMPATVNKGDILKLVGYDPRKWDVNMLFSRGNLRLPLDRPHCLKHLTRKTFGTPLVKRFETVSLNCVGG